jgi:hypothetical protein
MGACVMQPDNPSSLFHTTGIKSFADVVCYGRGPDVPLWSASSSLVTPSATARYASLPSQQLSISSWAPPCQLWAKPMVSPWAKPSDALEKPILDGSHQLFEAAQIKSSQRSASEDSISHKSPLTQRCVTQGVPAQHSWQLVTQRRWWRCERQDRKTLARRGNSTGRSKFIG